MKFLKRKNLERLLKAEILPSLAMLWPIFKKYQDVCLNRNSWAENHNYYFSVLLFFKKILIHFFIDHQITA